MALGVAYYVSIIKKLADILGEPLLKAYRLGEELNLIEAEDSIELSDSKDAPSTLSNKPHPRDGEWLNEDGTRRLWKGYSLELRATGSSSHQERRCIGLISCDVLTVLRRIPNSSI